MGAQLGLWRGDATRLASDSEVVLSVRESARARQLILQALPPRTVELVVPRGMRVELVQSFIREHQDWIDRAGSEMLAAYPAPELRPDYIELAAVGQRVAVSYLNTGSPAGSPAGGVPGRYRYTAGQLSLYSARDDSDGFARLIRRWLLAQGKSILTPWLATEARRTGLCPSRVQLRLQKTRWGSCSSKGSISINAALLLVPPELVRYLLVHELCHLQYMSHSRRYWQTVARHEPDFRALDRRLAASWRDLPAWLFALANGERAG